MRRLSFVAMILWCSFVFVGAKNPIRAGLPEYGIRDCHVIFENNRYYMTGTEISAPGKPKEGIALYESRDMKRWERCAVLLDRDNVAADSPYRDGWDSPEITKIDQRYVLTFGGRNNDVNPYAPTQIVVAVSDNIAGPYTIITPETLLRGNRFTLLEDDGRIYAYWELDGSLYGTEMDRSLTRFISEAQLLLKPRQLRRDDRFLDAPSMLKIGDTYHLIYTVFKGGYYATFATSDAPLGPWSGGEANEIFYRSEDQAPTILQGRYDNSLLFAPPCEIIGNVQFFQGRRGRWYVVYHSEDKYAEPYLCIDEAEVTERSIKVKLTLP